MLTVRCLNIIPVIFALIGIFGNSGDCYPDTLMRGGDTFADCTRGVFADCKSQKEEIVWAPHDSNDTCIPFRNTCAFNKENCFIRKRDKNPLRKISRETCKELFNLRPCSDSIVIKDIVCATREAGSKSCMFDNICKLHKHIATTGQYWQLEKSLTPCTVTSVDNLMSCNNGIESNVLF